MTETAAVNISQAVDFEMKRIRRALETGDGDKEDLVTYAKEVVSLRYPAPPMFASRHNDETGECEPVEVDPPMLAKLRERMSDRSSPTNLENAERAEMELPEDVIKLAEDLIPHINEEPGRNLRDAMVFYACRAIMQDRSRRPLVKELEWDGNRASSEVGFYAIQRADGEWALLRGKTDNFWQCIASGEAPDFHEAFAQAKAAAQSDFASRIRSCLLDKPEAVEGVRAWEYRDVEGNWHLCRDLEHRQAIEDENWRLANVRTVFRPLYASISVAAQRGRRDAFEEAAEIAEKVVAGQDQELPTYTALWIAAAIRQRAEEEAR